MLKTAIQHARSFVVIGNNKSSEVWLRRIPLYPLQTHACSAKDLRGITVHPTTIEGVWPPKLTFICVEAIKEGGYRPYGLD